MMCDMCGKEAELFNTNVEGTVLSVCEKCSKFGKVIKKIRPVEAAQKKQIQKIQEPEVIEKVVDDFAQKLKAKRESLKLTQKEFANKLSEKESLIHHIESGKHTPNIDLAKKLEKILHIKLTEEYTEEKTKNIKLDSGSVTIGDLIKIKRRN